MPVQKRYKTLRRKFPECHIVRYVSVTRKGSELLTLKHRWLYSVLLWKFRSKPRSVLRIAKWSGLDRSRTLPKLLAGLVSLGLAVRTAAGKYKGVPPQGENIGLFAWWTKGAEPALASNWAVYRSGRSIVDGLVEAADAFKKHSQRLLALYFGCTPETIKAARKRLARPAPEKDNSGVEAVRQDTPAPAVSIDVTPVRPAAPAVHLSVEAAPAEPIRRRTELERVLEYCDVSRPACVDLFTRTFGRSPFDSLAPKEKAAVVGEMVRKYGTGEGLEDALEYKVPLWIRRFTGRLLSVTKLIEDIRGVSLAVASD